MSLGSWFNQRVGQLCIPEIMQLKFNCFSPLISCSFCIFPIRVDYNYSDQTCWSYLWLLPLFYTLHSICNQIPMTAPSKCTQYLTTFHHVHYYCPDPSHLHLSGGLLQQSSNRSPRICPCPLQSSLYIEVPPWSCYNITHFYSKSSNTFLPYSD